MAKAGDCLRAKFKDSDDAAAKRFAREMADIFDRVERQLINQGRSPDAAAEAAQIAVEEAAKKARVRKRQAMLSARANRRVRETIEKANNREAAALAHLRPDPFARAFDTGSVEMRRAAWRDQRIFPRVDAIIEDFRSKNAGFTRDTAGLRAVQDEYFGNSTNNAAARGYANMLEDAFEFIRLEFNKRGANIPRVEKWFPTIHNADRIFKAGKVRWTQRVRESVDLEQMVDRDTGLPMTREKLDEILPDVYDKIVKGHNDEAVGLLDRRNRERFFVFKDAEAWRAYQTEFGDGSQAVWNNFINYLNTAAKDLAMLDILGPFPARQIERMKQLAPGTGDRLDALFADLSGRTSVMPEGDIGNGARLARTAVTAFEDFRTLSVSAILGFSGFSAMADISYVTTAARTLGMPTTRVARAFVREFKNGNISRRQALRIGANATAYHGWATSMARYSSDILGSNWARRVAESVMRLNMLTPITHFNKRIAFVESLSWITEQSDKSWQALGRNKRTAQLQRFFERNNIGPEEWEAIRTAERFVDPETGADFITPEMVSRANTEAGARLGEAMTGLSSRSSPSSNASFRAAVQGTSSPLSVRRIIGASAATLMSFPFGVIQAQLWNFAVTGGIANRMKFIALLVGVSTSVGMLAEQAVRLGQGKEPLPFDENLASQGFIRGGAGGIIADTAYQMFHGHGSLGDDLMGLPIGNLAELPAAVEAGIEGDAGRAATRVLDFAKSIAPGQNLWFINLFMRRMIEDELREMADRDAARQRFSRQVEAERDQDSEFFAPPGEGLNF